MKVLTREFQLTRDVNIDGELFKAGEPIATLTSYAQIDTLGTLFAQGSISYVVTNESVVDHKIMEETPADLEQAEDTTPGSPPPQAEAEPAVEVQQEEEVDLLVEAGLTKSIADALRDNAARLKDDRLKTPEGIREFLKSGGKLEGMEKLGKTRIETIHKALGL